MKRRLALALLVTLSLTGVPSAANAAVIPIEDVRGDGFADDLDIVGGSLKNGQARFIVTVNVARVRKGAAIAVLDLTRGRPGGQWMMASRWRGHDVKPTRMLIRGVQERMERMPCAGMQVRWSTIADSALLSVPANCLRGGHYRKVRGYLLTESASSGADSDYAPETSAGEPSYTPWITRG